MRAFRNLGRFDATRAFAPWLIRIGRNAALDHLRRRAASPISTESELMRRGDDPARSTSVLDVEHPNEDPRAQLVIKEEARAVHAALGELEPRYREVIELFHFEELRYEEISEVLSLPLGTVMTRLFRARKRLAAALTHVPGVQ